MGQADAADRRPIVVQKYGGSSMADVAKIGRVADKVAAARRAGNDVVVVVSAMGKTTDGLVALARQAAATAGNGAPSTAAGEPPRRELDMLVSTGERVSMALLSIAIQARGLPAISFTGSQSGILTNDRHFDARIIEVRPHRIEDELERGTVVIVAGYQGMSYRREITTLGRGGSDTTAVALAAALEAERCEIYSDVDGVYSADPRVVPGAKHLPEIDPEMLQEMAERGAKVVCAQAVEWAKKSGIAIYARATSDAEDGSGKQTIVRKQAPRTGVAARAVALEAAVACVRGGSLVELPRLLATLERLELSYKDLDGSRDGLSFLVPLVSVPDWQDKRAALVAACAVQVEDGVAVVSVVGDGLATTPDALSKFVSALHGAGCVPSRVTAGPLRLSAVVASSGADDAQRAVHEALVA